MFLKYNLKLQQTLKLQLVNLLYYILHCDNK